jgi:uncharacterized protein (TIRG00374 family)
MGVMGDPSSSPQIVPSLPQARSGRAFSLAIGFGLSLLFTWLAFRGLDLRSIRDQMDNLRAAPILICLATQVLCQIWRFVRWGLMLRSLGEIAWGRIFAIAAVGTPAVTLLPARIGELARPVLVSEETEIDFGQVSATVVAERFVDGCLISLVFFFGLILLQNQAVSSSLLTNGLAFAAIFVCAGIGLWLSFRQQTRILRMIAWFGRFSPGASRLGSRVFHGFVEALTPIFSQRVFVPYLLISLALWATEALSIYSLFGVIGQRLPFTASIIVLLAIVVGTLIPSGPAHLGVFEYAVILALSFFGLSDAASAYFAALLHLLQVIVLLALALFGFWLGNIRFERILRLGKRAH